MIGRVLWGVNNIFSVETGAGEYECRIKGKVLDAEEKVYNPLTPGDRVEIESFDDAAAEGMIIRRLPRSSGFIRWNKKKQAPQIIAANVDLCICLTSPQQPPFRPRFIDRALVLAKKGDIEAAVICNKSDLQISKDVELRLETYAGIEYSLLYCSAKTGKNIESVKELISGKTVMLIGQSGVGKTSLLNTLIPGLDLKTAAVSEKYDRGKHTTVYSRLLKGDGFEIIDTPGIRETGLCGITPRELDRYFPEFDSLLGTCRYPACTHIPEPGCAVKEKLNQDGIHPDRYESYVRMYLELEELEKGTYG